MRHRRDVVARGIVFLLVLILFVLWVGEWPRHRYPQWTYYGVDLILIVMLLRALYILVRRPLVLQLDDRGVLAPVFGPDSIRWSEVVAAELLPARHFLWLALYLDPNEAALRRRSLKHFVSVSLGRVFGFPEFAVNLKGTDADVEAIKAILDERLGRDDDGV